MPVMVYLRVSNVLFIIYVGYVFDDLQSMKESNLTKWHFFVSQSSDHLDAYKKTN